jgi:purine-binding chemotaxis protein CheW
MALGKNLKRAKLLPEADEEAKKAVTTSSVKKKPTKKTVNSASKKEVKKKGSTSKTSTKTEQSPKVVTTKAKPKEKKTVVKKKTIALPQTAKTKRLSEKERNQRSQRRLHYLSELEKIRNKVTNWIIFEIEEELFAVDIAMTQRVIPTPEISGFPHTSPHVIGVAEVRNRPVIFIDLSRKYALNNPVKTENTKAPFALIVKPSADLVAILLQNVPQTLKINGNHLIPLPETANLIPDKESFIKFMYRLNDKIVYMLDIEGLVLADQGIHDVAAMKTSH